MSTQTPDEAMAAAADAMQAVIAACTGYRSQLEAAGFSPTAAEHMAIQYHASLLGAIFAIKDGKR